MSQNSEDISAISEYLKSLGLTKYEALVYIALLRVDGASAATEIHEISGVPRASVYPVLDRLAQKNLVNISNTTPKQFRATPPDEGITRLMKGIENDAELSKEALNKIYQKKTETGREKQVLIWSVYGRENILHKLSDLTLDMESDLRALCNWQFFGPYIADTLEEKKIKAVIITNSPDNTVFQTYEEMEIVIPENAPEPMGKGDLAGVFIIDSKRVLVIMGTTELTPTALYSESPGFVRFFNRYWEFIQTHLGIYHGLE
ncbi:MAG: helix-turn-helix domain-containing protein [Euryarchaeota archaeon]|nr:helix-turn-helix domain-containing protein [Euryarchaeota archaeon]